MLMSLRARLACIKMHQRMSGCQGGSILLHRRGNLERITKEKAMKRREGQRVMVTSVHLPNFATPRRIR